MTTKIEPMNPDVKTKWVAALRSGKYKQVKETLKKRNGGMCCLGVLCELYRQETGVGKWEFHKDSGEYEFLGQRGELPETVKDWAGLNEQDPRTGVPMLEFLNGSLLSHSFAGLNDNAGYSFEQIAQVIEEKF